MLSWRYVFVFLAANVGGVSLLADERADRLARRFDDCLVFAGSFEKAVLYAEALTERGTAKADREIQVRGMIREVIADVHFGRWSTATQMSQIKDLLSEIPDSSVAYAEYRMFHGYFAGLYLHKTTQGIDSLNEAMSIALGRNDDCLIAKCYYFLSVVHSVSGNCERANDYLHRSILFSRSADQATWEYFAISRYLRSHLRSFQEPRNLGEFLIRATVLARQLNIDSPWSVSADQRIRTFEKSVQGYHWIPGTPNTNTVTETLACQSRAIALLAQYYRNREWAKIELLIPLARETCLALQDATGLSTVDTYHALLLTKRGKLDEATQKISEAIELRERQKAVDFLAASHLELANIAAEAGFTEVSIGHFQTAKKYLEQAVEGYAQDNAKAFVDKVIHARQLTRDLQQHELAAQQMWFCFGLGLLSLGIVFLMHKTRSSRRMRLELQHKVDAQTESLRIAKEAAEMANRAKTDFLAHVNHELRNPLSALIGSCDLLDIRSDESTRKAACETIQACSENLLDVIEDVLDITQIESGKLKLNESVLSIGDLRKSIRSIVSPRLSESVELTFEVDDEIPGELLGDESKLRQVLLNLGLNAATHTDRGSIRYHFRWQPTNSFTGKLIVTVTDTGSGIESAQLSNLFRQYRTDESRPGTGLGLYICKAFVEFMRGSIRVNSQPGIGTTVHLDLPMIVSESAEGECGKQPIKTDSQNVLVIDDDKTNCEVLKRLLEAYGHRALSAGSWQEAKAQFHRCPIEVVFLDLRMPEMDGFEMIQRLRLLNLTKQPQVIALTGDATEPIRQRAKRVGFDGFVSKPFRARAIAELVSNCSVAYQPAA